MTLRIGIVTAPGAPDFLDYAIEAERLGVDWTRDLTAWVSSWI